MTSLPAAIDLHSNRVSSNRSSPFPGNRNPCAETRRRKRCGKIPQQRRSSPPKRRPSEETRCYLTHRIHDHCAAKLTFQSDHSMGAGQILEVRITNKIAILRSEICYLVACAGKRRGSTRNDNQGYQIEVGRRERLESEHRGTGSTRPLPNSPSNLEKSTSQEIAEEAKRIVDKLMSSQSWS